jgi:dihydrofolate reductase
LSRLRVHAFSVSLDGFGAGPEQDLEHPLGVGGPELFDWFFPTRTFQNMHGNGEGESGLEDEIAARGFENIVAWILGRNMFGPVRGPWPDESWRGWWGEEPPYHTPVFVLPRPVQGQRPTGNQAAYSPDSRSESAVGCSQNPR